MEVFHILYAGVTPHNCMFDATGKRGKTIDISVIPFSWFDSNADTNEIHIIVLVFPSLPECFIFIQCNNIQ